MEFVKRGKNVSAFDKANGVLWGDILGPSVPHMNHVTPFSLCQTALLIYSSSNIFSFSFVLYLLPTLT